jgi:nucleotide-binding universal stress UspA family protein
MARELGFRNLLVPVAENVESEQAMDAACRLAADRGAVITVLRVIEIPPVLPLDAHMIEEEAAAHRLLERMRAVADRYGVAVTSRIVRGRDAAEAIVAEAERRDVEVIVIGAPRKVRAAFGSTVQHALKNARCRVLVIAEAAATASLSHHVAA